MERPARRRARGRDHRHRQCHRQRASTRPAPLADRRRRVRGRRRGDRLPAPDPHPVPVHPGARIDRLHGPRGVHHGPADERCRALGPRLHSLAVQLRLRRAGDHGDPHHRRSKGSPDHHPRRPADDLFRAAAGLHVDHRRLHPRHQCRPRHRPAGTRHVRPLHRRDRRCVGRRARPPPHRRQRRRRRAS